MLFHTCVVQYGKVFRGTWRGIEVAVKRLVLPTNMSGAERNERMAIMEAAISSTLLHPNIVRTYTYRCWGVNVNKCG